MLKVSIKELDNIILEKPNINMIEINENFIFYNMFVSCCELRLICTQNSD